MITVDVTQEDIDSGQTHSCRRCPIALAIARATSATYVTVGIYDAGWKKPGREFDDVASLPEIAKCFILMFDAGRRVEPFTFELREETK